MWPIPIPGTGTLYKVAAIAALIGAVWLHGCSVGKSAGNAKIVQMKAAALEIQQQESVVLAGKINETREKYETAIATLNAAVATAVSGLRNRPNRKLPGSPAISPQCEGATGAELARPDAEFLIGEAAESDRWQNRLIACYEENDNLRAAMLGKQ